jgi:DNA-binding SARP family transcriptional activator/predicted ATPase
MGVSPALHIQLFGTFSLRYGQQEVTELSSGKVQALLVYLVLHRTKPQPRQALAYLFWPDSSDAQARTNLRQTLHQLKQRLPDAERYIFADTKTLQWNEEALHTVDIAEFQTSLEAASHAEQRHDVSRQIQNLEKAAGLYQGALLPGCYEDWLFQERDRLQQDAIRALETLISLFENRQDYNAAIRYGQQLLRIDPLHEPAYQALMKLYLAKGDRPSALRTYHRCCAVLQDELGAPPSPATCDAYHHMLTLETGATGERDTQPLSGKESDLSTTLARATPLVGRSQEWARLQADWQIARSGMARFVLIQGEAGIGKTRLAEELVTACAKEGPLVARTRCYAVEGRLAYAPITDWLRSLALPFGFGMLDAVWLSELTRLLPELLTEYPDLPRAQPLTESWQRQNFYEALVQTFKGWIETVGHGQALQPLLLVMDDVQWCDPETLEWLQYCLRVVPMVPLLMVGTARSEELEENCPLIQLLRSLHRDEQVTEIHLERLDADATGQLASYVAAKDLGTEQITALYQQTEGHPLFIVEMMRVNLLNQFQRVSNPTDQFSSSTPVPVDDVIPLPPKVYAVLSARLAQLSPHTRQLVSLAAAVGRSFTIELLQQASGNNEEDIINGLDELWHSRIIREQGPGTYDFSHDKLRDVAYDSISGPKRRLLHRRIADALETIHHHDLDAVSAQIAAHYEKAGLSSRAVPCYLQAADVAQRIYANSEAIQAFRQALRLLQTMPLTTRRLEQELSIYTRLGVSLVAVNGYGSPEVKAIYDQARALGQQLGHPPNPPVIRALAITAIVQGDLQLALELGQHLLALAENDHDTILTVEAHYVMGVTTFWLGDFHTSQHHLECAIERYQPGNQPEHLALYAQDPHIICLSRLAFTLWCAGDPVRGMEASQSAVRDANQLAHPFSLAYALTWTAMLHSHRRDIPLTAQYATEVIALSEEKQLGIWLAIGRMLQGWGIAHTGDVSNAIQQMKSALDSLEQIGAEFVKPYFLSLLADAYGLQGEFDTALALIQQAFQVMSQSGERWVDAELHWRQGELMRLAGKENSRVKLCFEQAVAIAHNQGAPTLALQAIVSLAVLNKSPSKPPSCPESLWDWLQQTLSAQPSAPEPLIFQQARTLFRTVL